MKKYIFLYGSISGIGGRQLYIQRKAKYLEANGWDVYIITSNNENIVLKNLQQFKSLMIEDLKYPIYYFGKKKIKENISKIIKFVGEGCKDIYVESQEMNEGIWAEHVANFYKTINLVYIIGEPKLNEFNSFYKNFYIEKIMNNTCVGVTEYTLDIFLNTILSKSNYKNNYLNIPFDTNEITSENKILNEYTSDLKEEYVKIFTIGRLEKSYVLKLLATIKEIINNNTDVKIALVIVGGSSNFPKLIDKYKKEYEVEEKNMIVRFTDNQQIISPSIFKKMDIFVGMGTAAINSISQKCPTICINPNTLKSPGILGIDTKSFAFGNDEKELYDVLLKLINDKTLRKKASILGGELFYSDYENNLVNEKALNYIQKIKLNKYFLQYEYSVFNIENRRILFKLLGVNLYSKISKKNKIIKKNKESFYRKLVGGKNV